jgi:riboflavin synthase
VSPETQKVTTIDSWECGCLVNIERAMTAKQCFGGHFVLGHVDTTAMIASFEQQADFHVLTLTKLNPACKAYLVDKGCITIDGISLTINTASEEGIKLMIIPHTLKNTNLENLKENDSVNIEFDYVAKIVAKQSNLYQPSVVEG